MIEIGRHKNKNLKKLIFISVITFLIIVATIPQLVFADATTMFEDSGQNLGFSMSGPPAMGDLDGDGDLDMFVENMYGPYNVWMNDGTGAFSLGQSLPYIITTYSVTMGDVDGDNDLDVILGMWQKCQVLLNNGSGIFSNGQTILIKDGSYVDLGDLDGDNDLDLFIAPSDSPIKIWLNDGNGNFSDTGQSLSHTAHYKLSLGDLDGDNDLDAFVTNGHTSPSKVWLNNGLGFFSDSGQDLGLGHSVALGDLDGDNDLDAFVGHQTSASKVLLNDGTGTFIDSGQNPGIEANNVSLGDLDGDNDLDAFIPKWNRPNEVWLNDGLGIFSDSGERMGNLGSTGAALGDLDGDADLDAFVTNLYQDNHFSAPNKVWMNTGPANTMPTIAVDTSTVTVDEGQLATNSGTVSDLDNDTLTLSASIGTVVDNDDGTWSWSFDTSDGPTESQTVTVTADDGRGGIGTATFTLTVDNVAPNVGQISAPVDPVAINTAINTTADFTDPGVVDTHTAVWDWGDGTTSTVAPSNGSVSGSHTYLAAGVYTLKVTVTDKDGGSGYSTYLYIVVYDSGAGFVTGGGWINSPSGAYTPDNPQDIDFTGKATFGFVSKYKKGATIPDGNAQFQFKAGDLNFHSSDYDWLVIAGNKGKFKGTGTINGEGLYGFMITAVDDTTDSFRIKIWDKLTNETIYDNKSGTSDIDYAATELGGGSVIVHNK